MTRFKKYIYAFVVFSSAMLATWTLGEIFSSGGFTMMEIALLVLFSSTILKIAAAFWNTVIEFMLFVLRFEPLILSSAEQPVSNNQK